MTKVILTAAARADLREIQHYTATVLMNPSASKGMLKRITAQLRTLEQFPEAGTPILPRESPVVYRYLVCGSYMAFYHIQRDTAVVDRILYGRRDYLAILFGDQLDEETE